MILITCSQNTYLLTGEYIESISYTFKKRNKVVKIHNNAGVTNVTNYIIKNQIRNSLIIFVQYNPINLLPEYNNKIYYLNMDQILDLNYRKFSVFDKISNINVPIIDYSMKNINIINEHFPNKKTYFFPYMYNPNDTIFKNECTSEYDVGIVYSPSPHRTLLVNNLIKNNIKTNKITNKYGADRDKEICKCKILLNIHYVPESNILESIRCYPILFKKIVLISENSDYDPSIEINNLIIYESYDNLSNKILEILKNYDIYKNKLDNFNFIDNIKNFEKNIDEFIMTEIL